jgi:hypothetical protein
MVQARHYFVRDESRAAVCTPRENKLTTWCGGYRVPQSLPQRIALLRITGVAFKFSEIDLSTSARFTSGTKSQPAAETRLKIFAPRGAFTTRPEAGRLSLKFDVLLHPQTGAARLPRPCVRPTFPLRKDYLP